MPSFSSWMASLLALALTVYGAELGQELNITTCNNGGAELGQELSITTCNNAVGYTPIKEITYLRILPLQRRGIPFNPISDRGEFYVEFDHRGVYRGKSLPLTDPTPGDGYLEFEQLSVNLPIVADDTGMREPVKCTIKRKRTFLPDKVVATADIVLRDGPDITSVVRDLEGKALSEIKLGIFTTKWVPGNYSDVVDPSHKMDFYYRYQLFLVKLSLSTIHEHSSIQNLAVPIEDADPHLETVWLLDGMVEIPKEDEFFKTTWKDKSIELVVTNLNKFWLPFTDNNNPVRDRVALRNEIRTGILARYLVQPNEGRWVEPLSDESMHRAFFSNMGMFYTNKTSKVDDSVDNSSDKNGYVVDLTCLSKLKYREDFENLGCKVYFDRNADITKIEVHGSDNDSQDAQEVYRPGDPEWGWAKLKARSAAFIIASLQHLVHYHLNWANTPGLALRKFLSPKHPFRIAFTPHFYRTHKTCANSKAGLIAKRGPLGRLLPFEYEGGYRKVLEDLASSFKFSTYPNELKDKGMANDEYHAGATDGIELHNVLMNYVSNLMDEINESLAGSLQEDGDMQSLYYFLVERMEGVPPEFSMANLKMVWGEILFRVTGGHQAIGNAGVHALEPFMINFRMKKNDEKVVVGNREVIFTVAVITALTMWDTYPNLSDDWSNVTWSKVLHESESGAYAVLKSDLDKLEKKIDERNEERRFVNKDFHPKQVSISVFG